MKCTECGENVDLENSVSLRVPCGKAIAEKEAFTCTECSRLHFSDGTPVFNPKGERAFWDVANECVVLKKEGE